MRRPLEVLDLGRMRYGEALRIQQQRVEERKRGEGTDALLFVEHPHVVTMGRNGKQQHVLASEDILARTGIEFYETDRGGDVTYHGPGQIVGYPILDLREWRRDVRAYFRGVEQCLIDALGQFGLAAERIPEAGYEGVWVGGAKIAAIGIHISRWVTSHGFALNMDTDLSYFKYIVPCGLAKPVCSLRGLGCQASREEVMSAVACSFARTFDYEPSMAEQQLQEIR
ncbi:MAG TPA: lipoyl(octanoyl) transferase LipB [Bryobacteraceae bacterium]|jgi:lipoate-protein ligase B|nr:lipoyl(octanoyl) transferase LipB [Bryobacteraceae bacterium]